MLREDVSWRLNARCAGMNPAVFFPEPKEGTNSDEARSVCAQCHVWRECATFAIKHGQTRGIYGGMNLRERRRWAQEIGLRG